LALLAQEVVDRLERRACHAVKDDLVNVFAEACVPVAIRLELPFFTRIPRDLSPFDVAPIDRHELLAGRRDDEPSNRVGARGHRLVTPDRRRITALERVDDGELILGILPSARGTGHVAGLEALVTEAQVPAAAAIRDGVADTAIGAYRVEERLALRDRRLRGKQSYLDHL